MLALLVLIADSTKSESAQARMRWTIKVFLFKLDLRFNHKCLLRLYDLQLLTPLKLRLLTCFRHHKMQSIYIICVINLRHIAMLGTTVLQKYSKDEDKLFGYTLREIIPSIENINYFIAKGRTDIK